MSLELFGEGLSFSPARFTMQSGQESYELKGRMRADSFSTPTDEIHVLRATWNDGEGRLIPAALIVKSTQGWYLSLLRTFALAAILPAIMVVVYRKRTDAQRVEETVVRAGDNDMHKYSLPPAGKP